MMFDSIRDKQNWVNAQDQVGNAGKKASDSMRRVKPFSAKRRRRESKMKNAVFEKARILRAVRMPRSRRRRAEEPGGSRCGSSRR